MAIANPRNAKGFAITLGQAKTDKLDAEVIARFAQRVNLQPQPAIATSAQQLSDLPHRRQPWVGLGKWPQRIALTGCEYRASGP